MQGSSNTSELIFTVQECGKAGRTVAKELVRFWCQACADV